MAMANIIRRNKIKCFCSFAGECGNVVQVGSDRYDRQVMTFVKYYQVIQPIMRSNPKQSTDPGSPIKQFNSTKKNFLADRLFDRPNLKPLSQDKRPRIFSNQSQEKKLTPSITKVYQKRISNYQSLPPIQPQGKKQSQKFKTQMQEPVFEPRITGMKEAMLAQTDEKRDKYHKLKSKQFLNRTKLAEHQAMNKTLRDSREVINLIDKMQGKKSQKQIESPLKFHKKSETNISRRVVTQTKMQQMKEKPLIKQGMDINQIDGFIQMAEQGEASEFQFYYMLKKQSNDYYNMQIVSYQNIIKNKIDDYFTLSGHGVTMYEQSRPIEFTSLQNWNEQRKQFNELKQLQFFKKFRKWKSLKKWITILSQQKLKKISNILSQKLFILNPQYRAILVKHSNVCYEMQQFKLIDIGEACDLTTFQQRQQQKKNVLITNLKHCSQALHENSVQGLKTIVQELKNIILGEGNYDEVAEKKDKALDEKTKILTQMGFPSTISYGSRSRIRLQCMRFLRLAYLLDFIAIQAMGKMFVNNIDFVKQSLCSETQKQICQKGKIYKRQEIKLPPQLQFGKTCNPDGKNNYTDPTNENKPIFAIQVNMNDQKLEEIQLSKINATFVQIKQDFMKFDLQGCIFTENKTTQPQANQAQSHQSGQAAPVNDNNFQYESDTPVTYRYSPKASSQFIELKPSKKQIIDGLIDFFSQTLDSIQIINRWAKNEQFADFVGILEEWDELIGENWQKNDQKYLNPVVWIRQHSKYRNFKNFITSSISNSYSIIQKLIEDHNKIINIYVTLKRTDFEILKDPQILDQSSLFQLLFETITKCEDYMNKYFLQKADMSIYSIQFGQFKRKILQRHSDIVKSLAFIFAKIIKQRSSDSRAWLVKSISELQVMIVRIQQFLIKKANMDRIQNEFQYEKQKINVIKILLKIIEDSAFSGVLTKEQKQKVNQLITLSATLTVTISDTESQMPKYIQIFRKQIRLTLEKFEKQSQDIRQLLKAQRFSTDNSDIAKSAKQLSSLLQKMKNLDEYSKKHRKYEQVLQLTQFTNFKDFKDLKALFTIKQKIYSGIVQLDVMANDWNSRKFKQIDVKMLTGECDKYTKDLLTAQRQIADNKAIPIFRKKLFVFKDAIPVISAIRCPYLEQADFIKINGLLKTNVDFKNDEQYTLGQFLSLPFQQYQQQIIDISVWATQYFYLKKQLDTFQAQWLAQQLKLKQYKQTSQIIIIYEIEQLTIKLDQSLATSSNIISNRYIGPLRERAQKILNDIILAQQIIQKIIECQKRWIYLQNIFSAQDIKKQLMVEAGHFTNADKFLKGLMKKTFSKPSISRLLKVNNVLIDLTRILQQLEQIEKKLQDYLQVKRRAFPRFYFISNDELVEILANSVNTAIVQKHINKLFQGIGSMLIMKQTPSSVDGMISPEGEQIKFTNVISMRFSLQIWLMNMQKEMVDCIKKLVRQGNSDRVNQKQKTRILWILNHKSQAVTTGNQILWSHQTQQAIKDVSSRSDSLYSWYEILVKQLKTLTQLIQSGLKDPIYHKIAVALITADVHNRDIVSNLIANQVESIYDFAWQQQLKYSIEDGEHTVIRQVTAQMEYGYEYLGATSRLVITPLTDRCWITITSAIANHLGASPAGPAGTGKTQSTKDLAKGLARVCIVFNCSDQITAQMMSKLFSGLAQQGAWTCLDEFNRIDIQVLSVIAQQLFSIRVGLKKQKGEVQLQGKLLPIKKNFGVFITMNPGYAGRTQLPDNLKSLFRPVSMMIPDYTMIAQIMLFAQGFVNASQLSRKMVQLYKLSSQQLSQQKHYDFGLRAVKSLLVMAGELRRANLKSSEDQVLIRAMKDSNIPKFLVNDIFLFQALVSDLFPSVIIEKTINQKLSKAAKAQITKRKLGNHEQVSVKVIQLYQVINIRFGVMIVGEAGVGKTSCYRILKSAMAQLIKANPQNQGPYRKIQQKVINPKSVTMGELYGQIDVLTQQWTDGLLSSVMRECNNCQDKGHYWITLDGPVDAMWIENLNTVLDDNMTLCLANGQRIKLRIALRMLFEVQNLEAASPATVSRCGMVYIGKNKNYVDYIKLQIDQFALEQDYRNHIKSAWAPVITELIAIRKDWKQPIFSIQLQVAQCFITLLQYFLKLVKIGQSYQENIKKINFISAYCVIWSVGSSIQTQAYASFETALRALVTNIFFPKTQTIFDFFPNPQNFLSFTNWQSKLVDFEFPKQAQFHELLVPTINTLKYSQIFKILLVQQKPVLFTGQSGVGKTSLTVPYLFKQKQNNISTIFLNFSAKTKPKDTQLAIQSKLNKKGKTLFGAKPNETIVVFIDDINLPQLQKEGAQPTIELLRHFLDYGGFYDRHKLFWKQVVETNLVSCGATPSGGRNKLNPRFVRHSMVVCLPQPSDSNLKKIFGTILKGFYNAYNFSEAVKKAADGIVSSTLIFYNTIKAQLLPIPSKFHYQFNLRDISKVFQGVLQSSIDTANTVEKVYLLWYHQMQRIFSDRLTNDVDRQWFESSAIAISKRFGEGVDADKLKGKQLGVTFTTIMTLETEQKMYQQVDDIKKISQFLESKMYEYNVQTSGKLQLVFFKQAIQHILRISRILVQPRGNAMLIGVGGSGKQSLSKLSAFISLCKIQMLEIGKGYNNQSFRADLQKISISAGVLMEKVCFLFVDTQIIYEDFLQSINNMLNTGEVPNLFKKKEEIDDIMNRIRPHAIKAKKIDSPQSLWSFFISNIRSNLHTVLCMSPAGDSLRIRSRKFPSLINCCTIDWFNSWSQQALTTVAKKFILNMNIQSNAHKDGFVGLCTDANVRVQGLCLQYYQDQRRKVEVTPKTFLDQLQLFNDVLTLKNKQMEQNHRILSEGLEKLYSTNDVVAKLKIQMTKLQPQLAEQCIKTQEFLKRLAVDKAEANTVEIQVEAEAADMNQQTKQIKAIKEDAQKQLGKAMPMLLQAEDALKKINKNDITEIKGYASPHPIVQMVMEAVCLMLGEKTDWASIKVTMMEMNFLDRLKNYDKNNISDNILKKLRNNYTNKPQFDPVVVGQKNLASKSLCMWCKAIDNYAKVAKEVEPKKQKLAELEKVFQAKNKQLFLKQKQLNKVKQKVAKLQKQCEETLQYKNKLQNDLNLTANRLDRAQKLTVLLKDEGLRWNSMIQNFKVLSKQIAGEAFISSVILSYLGPFTGSYRESFIDKTNQMLKKLEIPYPKNFSLTNTMYDQITVRDWILQGLPNDPVSVDNAIIAQKGKRYPLMIDPQGQANKWLKVNQQKNSLAVVNFQETHYLKSLETAVKCGYSVLIEQVEQTLESSIDSLLYKKVQNVEGLKMIVVGDKKVPYDDKFYLYMTTRISNPKLLAEIFNKSTVINFSITEDGLKDQLLAEVSKLQKPQIEQQRDQIIVKVAANKKFLKQSQDRILKLLAESKGMVLDDVQLITTLQQSKVKSKQVEKDLQRNSIVEQQINRARNLYVPVALRGTILYFIIAKLCLIEPMYEFSLGYVKKLYEQGLKNAEHHAISDLRINKLNDSVTKVMFTNVSRALFEAHKKLYSFLICSTINKKAGFIPTKQWNLFSKGPGLKPKNFKQLVPNPDPKYFSDTCWFYLHKLAQIPQYANILSQIKNNLDQVKQHFDQQNIYAHPLPFKQLKIVSNFTLLLLCRIVKPENLTLNMSLYVQRDLDKFYDQPIVTTVQQILQGCTYDVPVLFVLSTGVDPTSSILNYCLSKQLVLQTISLGQGQGKKAQALIQRAKTEGTWVLLNNCHLSKSWLGNLEKIIQQFSDATIPNKNFRLLLSSMPVNYFPSNILQNSNKITLQPPRGIKPNIQRSFKQISQDTLNLCPDRRRDWLRCLYSLIFFHALVQQRRKYGSLGFNVRYDFNDSDLQMSVSTLKIFLSDAKQEVNWDAIWYMVGQINYGGRVTDDWDRICLMSTLKKCLNPDLIAQGSDKFYYSDSQDYYCIYSTTIQQFQVNIQAFLPAVDSPQVFGLHPNANLSFIIQQSNRAINCIQLLEPKGGGNISVEDSTLQTIAVFSSLPEPINRALIPDHLLGEDQKILPSLTNFLLQEVDKFNTFLSVIKKTLDMLQKAIKGLIPMNQDLDQMTAAFAMNQIPKVWRKYCYQTLKSLSGWFVDFKQRIEFLRSWMEAPPVAYWISCFFFPQGLLTAILQTYARRTKVPIDTLAFKFKVVDIDKQKLVPPKDGVYIYGLFFAGARWDSSKDTIAQQKIGQINEPVPFILFTPSQGVQLGQNQYNCPCYKTSARSGVLSTTGQSTNFILGVHLNSKIQRPQYWTLKGAALICQLDY